MKRKLSDIFIISLALALFLDGINVDDIYSSHSMVREEYQGQTLEDLFSSDIIHAVVFAHSTAQGPAYLPLGASHQPIYLIDEDSPSLPAHLTITQDIINLLNRNVSEKSSDSHIQTYNFHSLCKLQI